MCNDPQVGPDDLHVNAMLLFSDDHRPPQASVVHIPLLIHVSRSASGTCFGRRHRRVICTDTEPDAVLKYLRQLILN